MPTFSVAEAKNNLSKLIDLALKGEQVTITRHGIEVIGLTPKIAQPQERRSPEADIEWLRSIAITPKPGFETPQESLQAMRDGRDE
jgi:prevent-host-death family protein